jgi:uncharacterized protein
MSSAGVNVVFDCVIYAQALINPNGVAGRCIDVAQDGHACLFLSEYVLNEIRELPSKLPAEYGVTPAQIERLVDGLLAFAVWVDEVPAVYAHPHDPDDSHYVNLALATGSELIVSRDRHLLNLMDAKRKEAQDFMRLFPTLRVLDPPAFLREIEDIYAPED